MTALKSAVEAKTHDVMWEKQIFVKKVEESFPGSVMINLTPKDQQSLTRQSNGVSIQKDSKCKGPVAERRTSSVGEGGNSRDSVVKDVGLR